MNTPGSLARPNRARSAALLLTRVSDRTSFLYLDRTRVEQDDNGTHTRIEGQDGLVYTTYLPVATLACVLLGPGTSISAPAASALARSGCAVVMTGAGAVRSYSTWSPLSGSTALLAAQARISSDPQLRTEAAIRMLRMRFPDTVLPTVNGDGRPVTLEQLRGLEGARVKAVYREHVRRHRLSGWVRRKDVAAGETLDAVNEAMNYANTAMYGVCLAVTCALGLSPGLGILHEGNPRAFVLDIADLYKTQITVPLAFKQAKSRKPGEDAMRALRDDFRLLRLLPRIVGDIHKVLSADPVDDEWDINELSLWGSGGQLVRAEHNRHQREDPLR